MKIEFDAKHMAELAQNRPFQNETDVTFRIIKEDIVNAAMRGETHIQYEECEDYPTYNCHDEEKFNALTYDLGNRIELTKLGFGVGSYFHYEGGPKYAVIRWENV